MQPQHVKVELIAGERNKLEVRAANDDAALPHMRTFRFIQSIETLV